MFLFAQMNAMLHWWAKQKNILKNDNINNLRGNQHPAALKG